jgi:hypothetical protein
VRENKYSAPLITVAVSERVPIRATPSKEVISITHILPFVKDETPFRNTNRILKEQKYNHRSQPAENYCYTATEKQNGGAKGAMMLSNGPVNILLQQQIHAQKQKTWWKQRFVCSSHLGYIMKTIRKCQQP